MARLVVLASLSLLAACGASSTNDAGSSPTGGGTGQNGGAACPLNGAFVMTFSQCSGATNSKTWTFRTASDGGVEVDADGTTFPLSRQGAQVFGTVYGSAIDLTWTAACDKLTGTAPCACADGGSTRCPLEARP